MHNLKFINRESELAWLESCWRAPRAQLLVVYGRRRVGKTSLIERFARDRPHIYYLCSKGVETEQLELLSERVAKVFNDPSLTSNPFRSWDGFFSYIAERSKQKRFILAIDEFPFLVRANPAITSIFLKYWDEMLSKTKIVLILCSSSIAMMESELLAYKSPLYGRRTGQWKVLPLKFKDVLRFFPKPDVGAAVPFFSVTGGVPSYLIELDLRRPIAENIRSRIARKGKILYEEGEFMIKEELAEPQTYFSILKAVAEGRGKQAEIANAIGMSATAITRYLTTLIRLGFLERRTPVTEKARTKRAAYAIADPFLQFWFRFIYHNKAAIEEQDHAALERALAGFNRHVGAMFERVCAEALHTVKPFDIQKLGPWWGAYRQAGERKAVEIDIVGLNEQTKEILFAECKWREGVNAQRILSELKERSRHVDWNTGKRKEHYAIFAKSFKKRIKEPGLLLFDLKALEKALGKR
jgi:hypothetical protein